MGNFRPRNRKFDSENYAFPFAFRLVHYPDMASMSGDDLLRNAQTQSDASGLGGEEGIEYPSAVLEGDGVSRIEDFDHDALLV